MTEQILPITNIPPSKLNEKVLVVGDPARAAFISELLDNPEPLASSREYVSFNGLWKDTPITVVSHGVGSCGAAPCFEELMQGGATHVVRAGTAGGLVPEVTDGDLVVCTAAVRDDGLTNALIPAAYPAVSDRELTNQLVNAAYARNRVIHEGVVATMASFYPSTVFPDIRVTWRDCGAIAVEMEVAALLVIAALHKVKAGAIVAIDGNPLNDSKADMTDYDPDRKIVKDAISDMIAIALDALV